MTGTVPEPSLDNVRGIDPLIAVLVEYRPQDPVEASEVQRVLAVAEGGNPWSRDIPLHVTASALVVDRGTARVLLRWHTRMQRWLQVGGHGDPGERDPWLIACREAKEETGLADLAPFTPAMSRQLVHVAIVPVPAFGNEPAHEHADLRYLLATGRPDEAVAELPGAALRWMTIADAEANVEEENLRESLQRIRFLTQT